MCGFCVSIESCLSFYLSKLQHLDARRVDRSIEEVRKLSYEDLVVGEVVGFVLSHDVVAELGAYRPIGRH